jgi:hypothetical protein
MACDGPGVANPAWGSADTDRLGFDGAGRMIVKRYLFAEIVDGAYDSTAPVVGFTTAFDNGSNKLYERHLHAESRGHLYQPFTAANVVGTDGYDSLDRLRKYERGELSSTGGQGNAGGGSVATPISLPNAKVEQSYGLDALGNWKKTVFTPVGAFTTAFDAASFNAHHRRAGRLI